MKLRRAVVAMAATSVIAPLAFLSAPAAFATDGSSATPDDTNVTQSFSTGESTTDESTNGTQDPQATSNNTAKSGEQEANQSDKTADPATGESDKTADPTTDPATGESDKTTDPTTDPATDESDKTTDPTTDPATDESDKTTDESDETADDEDEDELVPLCEELDADYAGAEVSAVLKGLPSKIVAGDGYHPFKLVVTNDSEINVHDVAFYAEIENWELEDPSKFLSPYVHLEFNNPETGAWERIGDEEWAGAYFFFQEEMKPGTSQSVSLRVSIDAKAPAGDAYSFGAGAYLDEVDGQECVADGWAMYEFEVLKPNTTVPTPVDDAKQSDKQDNKKVEKPSVLAPQGNIKELPTGTLAETGSNSALPMIGLAGGLAVAVGVGAMFVVRRRKAGAEA